MQIEEYIVELLRVHECVVIPGLGGFVKKPVNAAYLSNLDTFNPPTNTIVFNAKLTENDGLLIQTISQRENKSFLHVKRELNEYVSFVKSSLKMGETVMLQNIGFLFLESSNIRFVAMRSTAQAISNNTNFGLPSFTIKPLETEQVSQSMDHTSFIYAVRNYAAIFVLLINVLLLVGLFSPLREPIEKASVFFFSKQPVAQYTARPLLSMQKSSIDLEKAQDLLQEVDQLLKTNHSINQPSSNVIPSIDHSYKLIIGCFKSEENAQKCIQSLSVKYKDVFYFYHHGLYKVCVYSGQQKEILLQNKVDFEQKTGNQAWILDTSSPNS